MKLNRRELSQGLLLLSAGSALAPLALAQGAPVQEGSDYIRLGRSAPVDAPAGQVEVVEFFWYNCPHCHKFEPMFDAWAKRQPAHVSVRRVPVAFRDSFKPQQQLFYTLEALGKLDSLHRKVFQTIHGERKRLEREDAILDWAEAQGLDRKEFASTFNSFGVVGKAKRAAQLQDLYLVDGVPALGVAGKYLTSPSIAKTMPRCLEVADALIAKSKG